MLIIICVIVAILFLKWQYLHGEESLAALNAECDTGRAFIEWRLRNQGVYIGLSEEGRKLLGLWLEAYDWFLQTHKFIDGKKHREWMVSLFYDFPPKYPDGVPSGKGGIRDDAPSVFLSI
jgi:hypothetical protein